MEEREEAAEEEQEEVNVTAGRDGEGLKGTKDRSSDRFGRCGSMHKDRDESEGGTVVDGWTVIVKSSTCDSAAESARVDENEVGSVESEEVDKCVVESNEKNGATGAAVTEREVDGSTSSSSLSSIPSDL